MNNELMENARSGVNEKRNNEKIVIKRDGKKVNFTITRIREAIYNAYRDIYHSDKQFNEKIGEIIVKISRRVLEKEEQEIDIEDIQDIVIEEIDRVDKIVGKAFSDYREERSRVRTANSKLFNDIDGIFNQTSEEIINNANKPGDKLQTYRAMISDVSCNNYADTKIIPPHILTEHGKSIYVHDKNYLAIPMFNCMLVNWVDMLENGFKIADTFIDTPKSFTTAVALLSQIICHTTSNNYGGNTLPDLDIGLEKYMQRSYDKHIEVAKQWINDENKQEEYAYSRLEKEVEDGCQSLEYEILTLMNARGENPFVTISFGLSTTKFGRLFQKKYLEQRIKGYSDGTTPVFPKICFYLQEGLNANPGDPNYDIFKLAVKCSSIRMYPKVKIGA